ncbi:MAG: hypothetical protein ACREH8_21900, partial [Opitutaceae bacterium]
VSCLHHLSQFKDSSSALTHATSATPPANAIRHQTRLRPYYRHASQSGGNNNAAPMIARSSLRFIRIAKTLR